MPITKLHHLWRFKFSRKQNIHSYKHWNEADKSACELSLMIIQTLTAMFITWDFNYLIIAHQNFQVPPIHNEVVSKNSKQFNWWGPATFYRGILAFNISSCYQETTWILEHNCTILVGSILFSVHSDYSIKACGCMEGLQALKSIKHNPGFSPILTHPCLHL